MPPRREPSTRAVRSAATTASTTTTRTRTRATTTTPADDLAENLRTHLTVADAKGKERDRAPAPSRTTTTTRAARAPVRTASKSGVSDVAGLTKDLGEKLAIMEQAPAQSKEERCQEAMKAVNSASRSLSGIAESGWKCSSSTPTASRSKSVDKGPLVLEHAKLAVASLATLRELRPDDIDIERAASSVVSKLLSMEMYGGALEVLSGMHPHLPHFYSSSTCTSDEQQSTPPLTSLLSLPPPLSVLENDIHLTLISNYLMHILISLSYVVFSNMASPEQSSHGSVGVLDLAKALAEGETLLRWLTHFGSLPFKHTDSVVTRTYTALTKSSVLCTPTSTVQAKAMYRIRTYALRVLLHTSASVIKPTTFWDQTVKFSVSFVKDSSSPTMSPQGKAEVTETILANLEEIMDCASRTRASKEDNASWFSGSGFLGLCEYWMEFAKRANKPNLLQRISSLLHGATTPSAMITNSSHGEPSKRFVSSDISSVAEKSMPSRSLKQEATLIYAAFTQATVNLEQSLDAAGETDEQNLIELPLKIGAARPLLELAFANEGPSASHSPDDIRYADKIRRSFERLRRAAVKTLEALSSKGIPTSDVAAKSRKQHTRAVVDACVHVLDQVVTATRTPHVDLLTPLLDSLFALARTSLVIRNPMTYDDSFASLSQATRVLDAMEDKNVDQLALANYLRCISGAFHNIAGTLYQADHFSHAIRFLDQSCAIGEKALCAYRGVDKTIPPGEADDSWKDKEQAWAQLEEQMYRRWEILGVCHSKIGERKLAYESFANAVKAFPFFSPAFMECLTTTSASAAFDKSPTSKYIGGIIERMTYTAICELRLQPSVVSLKTYQLPQGVTSETLDQDSMRRAIAAILLEKQAEALEGCKWKDYARRAMGYFLDDALGIYHAGKMPIRRARVLLRVLELSQSENEAGSSALDCDDFGKEIDTLLSTKKLALDEDLSPFREQFRAILKLRLALLAHQQAQTSQFSRVVAYAEEASTILKGIFTPAPRQSLVPTPSPKVTRAQVARKAPTTRQASASRLPTARGRTRPAKTAATVPVTPRAKKGRPRVSSAAIPAPVFVALPQASLDALPELINLLRTCAHLLGLLGQVVTRIQLLILARRICERIAESLPDDYINVSIELAHEYVNLGKTNKGGKIYHYTMNAAKKLPISDETRALLFLRFAESQAAMGDVLKSSWAYCEAYAISETLPSDDKTLPTAQRIIMRVAVLERAAMAANTFALVQYSRDDPSAAISGLLQSLRLWNRALDSLSKLAPPTPGKKAGDESDNPFLDKGSQNTPEDANANGQGGERLPPRKEFPSLPAANGIEWRVVHGLLVTLFALTQAYLARGSPREAEYFAQQAKDLAESLNTPAMVGRAFARLGEIYLHLQQVQDSHAALVRAGQLVAGTAGPDAADVRRLHAEYTRKHANGRRAQQLYDEAISMLEDLDNVFATLDGQNVASRKSLGGASPSKAPESPSKQEALAPSVLMAALRQNIWLLHAGGEEYATLLERFRALSATGEGKAEESALLAKLSLESVYTRFQADMFLSSLSESIITLPTGMVKENVPNSASGQEVIAILDNAEKLFWSDLALIARRGNVFNVRDAAISLALIRALQTSLGAASGPSAVLAARLLDMSAAITLRREVLEVVQHKFPNADSPEDLQWPLMTSNGSILPPPKKKKARFLSFDSDDEEDDLDVSSDLATKYWKSIEEKYKSDVCDPTNLSTPLTDALPPNWTVVSISVTEDKNTLFATRQRPGREPLIFCIPLNKDRRDDKLDEEEDTFLTFDDALKELKEIIQLSDEGTRQAVNVRDDRKARAAWWAERSALDLRMKALLENIEVSWLGALKTILSEPTQIPHELLNKLWTSLERVFRQCIASPDKRHKVPLRPNDALLECFALLSPDCKDEELEDLVYFILDLYQFHGVQVATAEIDMQVVLVDLRTVLEEHAGRAQGRLTHMQDAHTFLVLDKNVAGIPWESIPILRGRSVSRIPGVDFLLDRLQYVRQTNGGQHDVPADRVTIDPRKAYFVLNPSGDLKNTEGRFAPWLKEMKSVGWEGTVGRPPSELQLANALTRKDLVIYFGHGGAEQYIRSHKVRHLPRCAATMLWGCSSGALKEMGDFDRIGTPYNYILSGCPTLVANLWDVTDRDIDKFTQSVFDKMRLTPDSVRAWTPGGRDEETSIVTAVAESRDICKLKYLTGAAPVVYGIPFYL